VTSNGRPAGGGIIERMIEAYCCTCDGTRPFEQPPCADGHGADCDEWYCTACGEAVLIGSPQSWYPDEVTVVARRRAA
jgi:hypothetical protein